MSPLYSLTSWSFSPGCPSLSSFQANPASQAVVISEWPRRAKLSANEEVATGIVIVLGPRHSYLERDRGELLNICQSPRLVSWQTWVYRVSGGAQVPQHALQGLLGVAGWVCSAIQLSLGQKRKNCQAGRLYGVHQVFPEVCGPLITSVSY